jgi:hypothetical protein
MLAMTTNKDRPNLELVEDDGPVPQPMDPADADMARRLVQILHRRRIATISEAAAVDIVRELHGVDRF